MALKTIHPDTENGLSTQKASIDNVIDLMHQWLDDKSDYDTKTWPELKKALDQDRLSERKLFNG